MQRDSHNPPDLQILEADYGHKTAYLHCISFETGSLVKDLRCKYQSRRQKTVTKLFTCKIVEAKNSHKTAYLQYGSF